jgi:hypothetical protein
MELEAELAAAKAKMMTDRARRSLAYEAEEDAGQTTGDIFDDMGEFDDEEVMGRDDDDNDDDDNDDDDDDDNYESMEHDELVSRLREMEVQVQQAADFGRAMMADVQQLPVANAEVVRLQEEVEEAATLLEESEWRIEELDSQKAALHEMVQEQQSELALARQLRPYGITGGDASVDDGDAVATAGGEHIASEVAEAGGANIAESELRENLALHREVATLRESLEASRTAELQVMEAKDDEASARVAAEREARHLRAQMRQVEERVAEAESKHMALASELSLRDSTEKAAARLRSQMELRLGRFGREFALMRDALNDPDKMEGLLRRLDLIGKQQAEAGKGTAAATTGREAGPPRELTLMVVRSDVVNDPARLKLTVRSLAELEDSLLKELKDKGKMATETVAVAIRAWDTGLDTFAPCCELADIENDRTRVELVSREQDEEELRQLAQTAIEEQEAATATQQLGAVGGLNGAPSDSVAEEISALKKQLAVGAAALQATQAELAGWKQQASTVAQTAKASRESAAANERTCAMMEFDSKETAHRERMLTLLARRRKAHALQKALRGWKRAFRDSLAADRLADLERREAEASAVRDGGGGDGRQLRWVIRSAEVVGAEERLRLEAVGENDKEKDRDKVDVGYTVYQIEVIATSSGAACKWQLGRRYNQFVPLRAALRAAPEVAADAARNGDEPPKVRKARAANGGVLAPFPSKFSAGSKFGVKAARLKDRAGGGGNVEQQTRERGEILGGWLSAVVDRWAGLTVVQAFLADDGSWNECADAMLLRQLTSTTAVEADTSSAMSGRLGRCVIERALAGPTTQSGGRAASEKNCYLGSVSRMVMMGGEHAEPLEVKKFYVVASVHTGLPNGCVGSASLPTGHPLRLAPLPAAANALEKLGQLLLALGHPYVQPPQELAAAVDFAGRPKAVVMRDFAPHGSIRDLLLCEGSPLRPYTAKYLTADGSAARRGASIAPPARLLLLAKQLATAMAFLVAVGIDVGFVHAGNVLLLSAQTEGGPESLALSDVENAFVLQTPDGSEPMVVASDSGARQFGLLLYEISTGHLLAPPPVNLSGAGQLPPPSAAPEEAAIAAIQPPELRPVLRRLLGLQEPSPSATKKDLWEDSEDPSAAAPLATLANILDHPVFAAVELSEQHTAAFPTEDELPQLRAHADAVRSSLREAAALPSDTGPEVVTVGDAPDAGDAEPSPPPQQPLATAAAAEPLDPELLQMLSECCADSTKRPPTSLLRILGTAVQEPVEGRQNAVARWLAARLLEGLAEPGGSIAVSMKTTQLLASLVRPKDGQGKPAADGKPRKGRFKGKKADESAEPAIGSLRAAIKRECAGALLAAAHCSRLDPVHGLKPAKMISNLAKQVMHIVD